MIGRGYGNLGKGIERGMALVTDRAKLISISLLMMLCTQVSDGIYWE